MSIGPIYHAHHVVGHEPPVMSAIHSHKFEEYVEHEPVTGEQNLESAQHRAWVKRGFQDSYDDVVAKAHRERERRAEARGSDEEEEDYTDDDVVAQATATAPQWETGFTILIDAQGNTLVNTDVPVGARRPVTDHEIKRGAWETYEFQHDRRVAGMVAAILTQPQPPQPAAQDA